MKNEKALFQTGRLADPDADDSHLKYQCKICHKRFLHSSALGGHISKAHPGQSRAYNHKKRVRETRELERELHRHTMQVYQDQMANQGTSVSEVVNAACKADNVANEGADGHQPEIAHIMTTKAASTGRVGRNG